MIINQSSNITSNSFQQVTCRRLGTKLSHLYFIVQYAENVYHQARNMNYE